MTKRAFAAATAAFLLTCGSSASAAIVTLTYTGTSKALSVGGTGVGFFGETYGEIADFTSIFVFDEGPTSDGFGGALLSATFTQNGIVYDFNRDGNLRYGMDLNFEGWQRSVSAQTFGAGANGTSTEYAVISIALGSPNIPEFRTDAFETDGFATRPIRGGFNALYIEYPPLGIAELLSLNPTHLKVTSTGPLDSDACCQYPAIPEPDTWALMLLGFGAAGGLVRRHQRLVRGVSRS